MQATTPRAFCGTLLFVWDQHRTCWACRIVVPSTHQWNRATDGRDHRQPQAVLSTKRRGKPLGYGKNIFCNNEEIRGLLSASNHWARGNLRSYDPRGSVQTRQNHIRYSIQISLLPNYSFWKPVPKIIPRQTASRFVHPPGCSEHQDRSARHPPRTAPWPWCSFAPHPIHWNTAQPNHWMRAANPGAMHTIQTCVKDLEITQSDGYWEKMLEELPGGNLAPNMSMGSNGKTMPE